MHDALHVLDAPCHQCSNDRALKLANYFFLYTRVANCSPQTRVSSALPTSARRSLVLGLPAWHGTGRGRSIRHRQSFLLQMDRSQQLEPLALESNDRKR